MDLIFASNGLTSILSRSRNYCQFKKVSNFSRYMYNLNNKLKFRFIGVSGTQEGRELCIQFRVHVQYKIKSILLLFALLTHHR